MGSVLRAGGASVDKAMVYRQVAQLQAENINQGFLSSLGPRFLALLYQAVDRGEREFKIMVGAARGPAP